MDIQGIALAKQMDDRRNILRYPNGPLSPAAPITPTADTFDTNPTNLERTTDGNFDTVTGDGTKILSGAGVVGQLVFDLGHIRTVNVGGRVGLAQNSTVQLRVIIDSSDDNITWRLMSQTAYTTSSTTNRVEDLSGAAVTGRYIRIRVYGAGACTAVAKFYQIFALELGI